MKDTLETRLGLFFVLALIVAAIILEMVGGADFLRSGLHVQARFTNVEELKVGDPVKMGGKQIGRVEDIRFSDSKVLVVMKITDHTAVVRTDSIASIKFSGLLGQNFVSLSFGTSQGVRLTDGQTVKAQNPQDLGELMAKLDGVATDMKKITGNLADVKLNEMIMPFTDFMKESRPRIMAILTNVESATAVIASGEGTVGKLIYDQTLYNSALSTVTNLSNTANDAKATVTDAQSIVADVKAGKGTLGKLTKDEKLYNEATAAATNLKEILQKINRGQGSVGHLVNDDSLVKNAKLTLQKLDKATDSLEDQGPLTVISILANPLMGL